MKAGFSRVFTLEVDSRPTLIFEASGTRQAQQICKESWLRDDLTDLRSGGAPLLTTQSKLSVRLATAEEAIIFAQAAVELATPPDDMVLADLVELED